jgi:hypothetical protein
MKTHTLETAEADIVYDVLGRLPTGDGRPPLFMIGQPMDASGFRTLASYFPIRQSDPDLSSQLADSATGVLQISRLGTAEPRLAEPWRLGGGIR